MEVAVALVILALIIFLLLLIILGFWVILPVDQIKEFLATIINDAHSTYKLGIASKQQPSSTHDKVATHSLYYRSLKHQYKNESNDTGTDDTDTETITNRTVTPYDINSKEIPDNKSSFESSSLDVINNDKNTKRISVRKNETKDCDKSPPIDTSFKWPSMLSSLPSPPPSPTLSAPPPPISTTNGIITTSSDEKTEICSETKLKSKKKKRKRNRSTSQPQSLPTEQRQKKPSVDRPYSSLKPQHPDRQKYSSDKPERPVLPGANVKIVPREARGAISQPQPSLSCPLPPAITVPSGGNRSSHSMVSPPSLPVLHHGRMSLESSYSGPPPVQPPAVPPVVVVRDEAVHGASNEEGGAVSQFDLVKFEHENMRAIDNERDINDDNDDDDDDDDARAASSLQLPELVTEHVPVQSSADAPPLIDNAWEAQQPIDVNMEPPTDEMVITPLVLHFPQTLQDEAELVLPDLESFKEPQSFIDSGDDIN
ncbi:PREDICTED: WASH complex subunit CCDC53 homolog [Amphimedon queenslandica]|uniref:Uncharacterized protein n=1 Tax=Amphimedon queenslandica TaxID=400682 RepID=A0A1X7TAQ8_AMPQE|nr:PREDICTED: WASH complex subunit CCDC53 homolog [Amphimedon queenslandica]|eukprot:XP_019860603.1 PREDICTED: WASH complex subunit CCDC53 homolog [Amphimedon queenslandica]